MASLSTTSKKILYMSLYDEGNKIRVAKRTGEDI